MVASVHFSSKTDDWATPQDFFDAVDREFKFTLDACATASNAKCKRYFTPEQNALNQVWGPNETVWCNPPYGRDLDLWLVHGLIAAQEHGSTVVFLVPARTDTRWFHDIVYGHASIRFIRGRLKFGGARNPAPFPSMLVIFRPTRHE